MNPAPPTALADAWDRLAGLGWRAEAVESAARIELGKRNRVFTVVHGGTAFIVRLPRERLKDAAWYAREIHNLSAAAAAGVTPAPLLADAADGLLVLPLVSGAHPQARRVDPDAAARIGRTLHRLHRATAPFVADAGILSRVTRRITAVLQDAMAAGRHASGLPSVARAVEPLAATLARTAPPPAPCHGDLVPGNMIDDGAAVHLIDWETSTADDPHCDIATVCLRTRLDDPARATFLAACLAGDPPEDTELAHARITVWEAVCALDKALTYWRNGVRSGIVDPRAGGWTRRCSEILAAPGTRAALLVLDSAGPAGP